MKDDVILQVKDLKTYFFDRTGKVPAVDGVDFTIRKGETLGIVGESGCGKSVTSMSILKLLPPEGKVVDGEIIFKGENIVNYSAEQMEKIRGKEIAMIFQEPMTSLNPVYTVGTQISEMITAHEKVSKKEVRERAIEMLRLVGIPSPEKRVDEYPHELSGGMRQRVMIAMALSCNPELLIADEPTTALDVTIQAQVLELMKQLIREKEMSMLMITHDLGVVAEVCEDVAVMYAGRIVEKGTADDVFNHMRHPYTEGLFDSLPNLKQRGEELVPIKGLMPDPSDLPPGCAFAPRCPYATEACTKAVPELASVDGSETHFVACSAYKDPEFRLRGNQDGR